MMLFSLVLAMAALDFRLRSIFVLLCVFDLQP